MRLLKCLVEARPYLFAQAAAVVLGIVGDSHNGERFVTFIGIVDGELPPQRILTAEEVLDHGFIHYGNARGSRSILGFDTTSCQNGNSHRSEIAWPDVIFHRDAIAILIGFEAGNDDRVSRFTSRE